MTTGRAGPEGTIGRREAAHRFDNAKRRRPDGHDQQVFLTPGYVLEPIRVLLGGIGLDPCTEPDNPTRANRFYRLPQDGCALPWEADTVFCNPPYGEAKDRWVDRCIAEGTRRRVVLLIPAATETAACQRALTHCTSVLFPKGRLRFRAMRTNRRWEAASHPSAIFGFGVDLGPISELGIALSPNLIAPRLL